MRIAIDGRQLGLTAEPGQYSGAILIAYLLLKGSRHQFILISDRPILGEWHRYPNLEILLVKPPSIAALEAFWYDFRLPALLEKLGADIFLGLAGCISLRSRKKQLLWLQDALEKGVGTGHTPWWGCGSKRRLYAMVKKADYVCLPSINMLGKINPKNTIGTGKMKDKQIGEDGETCTADKLNAFPLAIGFCLPQHHKTNESPDTKLDDEFSALFKDGMPYFLCISGWQTTKEAMELLLAFSSFKKRMQSGIRLVLADLNPCKKNVLEKLATYRYRKDVIVFEGLSPIQLQNLLASAYALIHLPTPPQMNWIFRAMVCSIPVITRPLQVFFDVFKDHVRYCTEEAGATLASHMIQLYKDEDMRSSLINKASQAAELMHPEYVSTQILSLIEKSK